MSRAEKFKELGLAIVKWRSLLALLLLITSALHAEPIAPSQIRIMDGDTIAVRDIKYRLVGFDTPETGDRARCTSENELGQRATLRLRALVYAGHLDLQPIACSCRPGTEGTRACNYGRSCARLNVNGEDVGDILIREKLAHVYICSADRCPRRLPWCQ